MIDWDSDETTFLINPRTPEKFARINCPYKGHVCVLTSGSSQLKWVALSKSAILASAAAVNVHLESERSDVWLNPLPEFHVGGLGIVARSFLSGAKVVTFENWDAHAFQKALVESEVTLTALVPTQVFDLVMAGLTPPSTLRAVVVGGGALAQEVYQRAKALGWPLLASYGLTEVCSQVATATWGSPKLRPLTHVEISIRDGLICIRSPSLLTAYNIDNQWSDPKQEGWLTTEDRGEMIDGFLHVRGRSSHFIKIGGESVDLLRLEKILQEVRLDLGISSTSVLFPKPDARLGYVIHLRTESDSKELVEAFNLRVFPFERIRETHHVPNIPLSALGKPIPA